LLVIASLIIGLTVPLSGSRSCSIVYGFNFAIYLAMLLTFELPNGNSPTFKKLVAGVIALVASGMLIGSSLLLHKENKEEMVRTTKRQYSNLVEKGQQESRFYISRDTWKMFAEKPIFGWGLGSYPLIINIKGKYLGAEHGGARFDHAHNDWLEYMAETGIFGFIVISILFLAPYRTYTRDGRLNPLSNWLWGGAALLLLYAIVEFPSRTPAVALLITLMIAIATKYGVLEKQRKYS